MTTKILMQGWALVKKDRKGWVPGIYKNPNRLLAAPPKIARTCDVVWVELHEVPMPPPVSFEPSPKFGNEIEPLMANPKRKAKP